MSKDKIRRDARKQVGRLLNENNHLCYYCNLPLVRGNRIRTIIYENLDVVLYIDDGIHLSLKVTVEHKKRIIEGFGNEEDNLTIACRPCNQLKRLYPDGIRLKYKLKTRESFLTNMIEKDFYEFYGTYQSLIPLYKWKDDKVFEFNNSLYLVKEREIFKVN
jgi:5-methylcytosine-specific restriction endonuclease McrA